MTPDLIGILSVGVALAALIVGMWIQRSRCMDRRDDRQSAFEARVARLEARFAALQAQFGELRAQSAAVEQRLVSVEHGQARLEGVLEGLIVGLAQWTVSKPGSGLSRRAAERPS